MQFPDNGAFERGKEHGVLLQRQNGTLYKGMLFSHGHFQG